MIKINKLIIFWIVIFLIILITTKNHTSTTNDKSRVATIESLVNRQTLVINESPYTTSDQILNKKNGYLYSSKPPLLSVIGAMVFYVLKNIFQLSLPGGDVPNLAQYLLTLIIVGGSFLVLMVYFFKSLQWMNLSDNAKYILTALIGFSTYLFSYIGTFNNHIPAAMAVFLSFYFILKIKFTKKNIPLNLFLCGLWLGLSGTIDITSGILLWIIFYLLYFLKKLHNKKMLFLLLIGFVIPVCLHLLVNWQITGDLFPAYMHKSWYTDPSNWNTVQPNKLVYIFNILIGHSGLFLYSPILLYATREMLTIMKNKMHQFYDEAWLLSIAIFSSFILIIKFIPNYGGTSYGFRYFIPFIPLIFFFLIFYFKKQPLSTLFQIIALYSIVIAILGTINPWSPRITISTNGYNKRISFPIIANIIQLQNYKNIYKKF